MSQPLSININKIFFSSLFTSFSITLMCAFLLHGPLLTRTQLLSHCRS